MRIERDANAKINVFLRVLSAREDGYHDLESLVVPIALADRVTVESDERLHVETTGPAKLAGQVPAGGLNLALVAALALADACPRRGRRPRRDRQARPGRGRARERER